MAQLAIAFFLGFTFKSTQLVAAASTYVELERGGFAFKPDTSMPGRRVGRRKSLFSRRLRHFFGSRSIRLRANTIFSPSHGPPGHSMA